jgi:hypothetical protein
VKCVYVLVDVVFVSVIERRRGTELLYLRFRLFALLALPGRLGWPLKGALFFLGLNPPTSAEDSAVLDLACLFLPPKPYFESFLSRLLGPRLDFLLDLSSALRSSSMSKSSVEKSSAPFRSKKKHSWSVLFLADSSWGGRHFYLLLLSILIFSMSSVFFF